MFSKPTLNNKGFATLVTYMHPGSWIMAPLMVDEGLVVSKTLETFLALKFSDVHMFGPDMGFDPNTRAKGFLTNRTLSIL